MRLLLAIAGLLAVACAKPYYPVRAGAPPYPPVAVGVTHATGTFEGRGGATLFTQSWRPEGEPRGVLVIMHGLRDHGDHYASFAARLALRGYAVHAFDLRGHGRSAGRRVTVDSFEDYVDDLDRFVARVRAAEPGKPVFVFGHSMGGAITALWAATRAPAVDGIILSAPALRVDAPPLLAASILLAGTLAPNVGGLAPDNRNFSSDPAVTEDMNRDPLIFQPPGPVGTARELVGGIERLWANVHRLHTPLLALHGTGDVLTAPAGSRELVARAPATDKTLRLYEGLFHDLVHEPKGAEVMNDVAAWLDGHTGGSSPAFAASDPAPGPARRLNGDRRQPSAMVAMEGTLRRTGGDEPVMGSGSEVRARFFFGRRVAWPLGLDLSAGSLEGFNYRAVALPAGLALVSCAGHALSLSGGGGVSDLGGGSGFAWEVPATLDAAVQLGPVRVLAWARVSWIFAEDARQDGSDLIRDLVPGADELHAGAAIRLGRNHRYWSTANAGTGPYVGVTFNELLGARVYGLVLGLDLWGGS